MNRLFFIFILSLIAVNAKANEYKQNFDQIRISYLTTNDGLLQNTVRSIIKDSQGFMWFGTWNGLCRYDGYEFKNFQSEKDSILPGNFIRALCKDSANNIWVGTSLGLVRYNISQEVFIADSCIAEKIKQKTITGLAMDTQSLWIATDEDGLWRANFNPDGSVKEVLQMQHHHKETITCVYELRNGDLVVGTALGVYVVDKENNTIINDPANRFNRVSNEHVVAIYQAHQGDLWVGTSVNGLFLLPANGEKPEHFRADVLIDDDLSHASISDIVEDNAGNILIGTFGGLNYFNPATRTFSILNESRRPNAGLNSAFVNVVYVDEGGNVWIGTEKGGVNYYNTYQKPFHSLVHDPSSSNTLSNDIINSIYDENGVLWVGTAGGGLNRFSKQNKSVTHYQHSPYHNQSLYNDFVTSILRHHGNLWVGTWGGGLNKLVDENTDTFDIFLQHNKRNSLANNYVSCLAVLDSSRILVGTYNGLDIYNVVTGKFSHVNPRMIPEESRNVGCIHVDSNGNVWMGTTEGLYKFQKRDLVELDNNDDPVTYQKYTTQTDETASLPGDYIISIYEAKNGEVWFGTYGHGILKYEKSHKGEIFIPFDQRQGLCNNVAYAMEESTDGHLWISTDNGLSEFDPVENTFKNYYSSDGLLSDQFYWSASGVDQNGFLYFGSIKGVSYFNPADFKVNPHIPQPVFTKLSVYSEPVHIGEKYHQYEILNKTISETDEIHISYRDAVISIEFSALEYFQPDKIKYAYKMEGVDLDWVEVSSSRRFANYTNLSGGAYTFKVKAANSDGKWSAEPTELVIYVKPPFYQTPLFFALVLAFVVLVVLMYIRYRTRYLEEQKRKLESMVKERTQTIEEQKSELERQNEQIAKQRDEVIELNEKVNLVNQLRLRFFTNISHEFRTPLTLIIDPLEQLIQHKKWEKSTQYTLEIINRNAQRLLHLINQLLYFRRIETGKLSLNVSKGNLVSFVNGIFESFKDLAESQQVDYQLETDAQLSDAWFDAEKVENVLYNLLSNAFKNTSQGGRITVEVKEILEAPATGMATPFVSIVVSDNGRGIEQEHLKHIFDRFYKGSSQGKYTDFTSSGIGLALSHEIVKALNGELTVESEPGKGSRFCVCMPYTRERFKPADVNETGVPTDINIEGRVKVLSDHIQARKSDYELEDEPVEDKAKPTVLVVEDNFDLRSFLLHSLRDEYRVLGAENGKLGLEMARKYSPEIIISDVMMPVMDGIELCSRLKKSIQTSHIPIILLTAKNMLENWIEGLETGADDYIPKPFNMQVLQMKMRNIIESRKRIKSLFSGVQPVAAQEVSHNKIDREFMERAYEVLEKNYLDPEFSVEKFAAELFVSRSLLYKKLKSLTDLNITDFINSYKLKKALKLMSEGLHTISDVAYKSGFNDPKYFSRIFKKFYNQTPSEYISKK